MNMKCLITILPVLIIVLSACGINREVESQISDAPSSLVESVEEAKPEQKPEQVLESEHQNDPVDENDVEDEILVCITADAGLRLRDGPGTDYGIIKVIAYGEYADVIEHSQTNTEWIYVCYYGDCGWLNTEYVAYEPKPASKSADDTTWVKVYHDYISSHFKPMQSDLGGWMVGYEDEHNSVSRKYVVTKFEFRNYPGYDYPVLVTSETVSSPSSFFWMRVYIINNGEVKAGRTYDIGAIDISSDEFMDVTKRQWEGGTYNELNVKGVLVSEFPIWSIAANGDTTPVKEREENFKKVLGWLKNQM